MHNRAGRSPTFWLALLGLAGTRGLASPIEEDISFKTSPSLSWSDHNLESDSRVRPGPASPWTRESQLTARMHNVGLTNKQTDRHTGLRTLLLPLMLEGNIISYTLLQKQLKFSKVAFLWEKIVSQWTLGVTLRTIRQNLKDFMLRSVTQGHQGKWRD